MSAVRGIDWDDLLSYQTVKYVTIRERKLGVLHFTLQFVIFAYIVLYNIVYEQRYLLQEPPYGSVRATVREPTPWVRAETLPYCFQNQSSLGSFGNYNCTYMRGTDITFPAAELDSIFISTRIKDTYYNTPSNCTTYPESMNLYACAPSQSAARTLRYFFAGIDNYTLYMEHAIFGRENEILVGNFDCDGELISRDGLNIIFDDPNRAGDIITLQTALNAAGISSLDDASGLGNSFRYDGALIVAVVSYTNYATKPSKFHYTYELHHMPKQDVVSMQPSTTVEGGTVQRNWYGVRVVFLVVGSIGYFDFLTLLTALVSGMVLIKVASVIVDMMILYILPQKRVYSKHKYELPGVVDGHHDSHRLSASIREEDPLLIK